MSREVITVTEGTPIEEAARIMIDNQTSGLPVMREGEVVGMITETDLFKIFLELFGAREPGVRITALTPDVPGELAKLTFAVHSLGGNIVALGTFLGESAENRLITLKVGGVDIQSLEEAIGSLVERVVDIRET
jgi:acetoin utilization protein AcuB